MEQWEYLSPKFGDLRSLSPPTDNFFSHNTQVKSVNDEGLKFEDIFSPVSTENESVNNQVSKKRKNYSTFNRDLRRRSRSLFSVFQPSKNYTDELNQVTTNMKNMKVSSLKSERSKKFPMLKNNLDRKKSISVTSLNKYISTAESVYRYQKDTPERFRYHSRENERARQLQSTVPHSPILLCKTRKRSVNTLSQKEIEDMEVKEMKNYKIKALPLSQAVLQGIPVNVPVERKAATKPEPFNLTEVKKKPIVKNSPEKVFHARPVPKHILEKKMEIPKRNTPNTVPKSPNITKLKKALTVDKTDTKNKCIKKCKSLDNKDIQNGEEHLTIQKTAPQNCQPKPFSFIEKDKERQMKKNEKIQKIFEEEKKMREFHANPVPAAILKKHKLNNSTSPSRENSRENKENKCNNSKQNNTFKARPALVLQKKPFRPVYEEKPLTDPYQFQLMTEHRHKERQMFDTQIKQKEEQLEEMRKMREEQIKQKEEQEIMDLRSQLVHKAAPVRQYPPFVIQPSSIPLTVARTPDFGKKA